MTRSTRSFMLRLKVESPLSVGSGRERGALREVLRVPVMTSKGEEDLPVIPATSLKGAFRGVAEMLGRSWGDHGDEPRARLMALHKRIRGGVKHWGEEGSNRLLDELSSGLSGEERSIIERLQDTESKLAYLCPICRLFGAPGLTASVRFSDAIPRNATTGMMTRTSIDRKSLKVVEGRLFTDEFVTPGSEFTFVMLVDVGSGSLEERLLDMVMEYVKEVGLQLGGSKSVGRGLVRIVEMSESYRGIQLGRTA